MLKPGVFVGFVCLATSLLADVAVPIPWTQAHELTSTHTGRRYLLQVGLPRNYAPQINTYTVVYQLDGQWDFAKTLSIARALESDQVIEPVIVVGITYAGASPDYDTLRTLDYTPTNAVGAGRSGEAGRFLRAVRDEIIPFVEGRYPARAGERILMGSSYGGLFTGYALLHASELFSGYVMSSPSFTYDRDLMIGEAARLGPALAGRGLKVRVISGAPEYYPHRESGRRFRDVLAGLRLSDFDSRFTLAENEKHGAVSIVAYYEGLPEVFKPKLVSFATGPGEPVGWTASAPAVTYSVPLRHQFSRDGSSGRVEVAVHNPRGEGDSGYARGVVYVLDAQWDDHFVLSSYGAMDYDGDLSNLVRATVGWEAGPATVIARRERDFTPSDPEGAGHAGGGAGFAQFFRSQLMPRVESGLNVAPGFRLVVASDKAALWALTDLLGGAPMFDRYLLVSPTVEWDDAWLSDLEAARAKAGGALRAQVMIYTGERESPARREAVERLVAQLRSRGYAGLQVDHVRVSAAGYAQAKLTGYHKGLRLLGR